MSDEPAKKDEPEQAGKRPNDPIVRLNRDRSEWQGELADPEVADHFEQTSPMAFLKRREFLARTAALAGAAGDAVGAVAAVEPVVAAEAADAVVAAAAGDRVTALGAAQGVGPGAAADQLRGRKRHAEESDETADRSDDAKS